MASAQLPQNTEQVLNDLRGPVVREATFHVLSPTHAHGIALALLARQDEQTTPLKIVGPPGHQR
eukprot:13522345-Alexandrium_andersonii.AAC.1